MNKLFSKLFYKLILKNFKPEIVPYKDHSGKPIENTRVSILSHLSNRQNLKIGKNVFIGHYNYIDGFKKLTIEEGCQITNYVSIVTHSSHNAIREYREHYIQKINENVMDGMVSGEVYIGEYTYIGPHTLITPGTRIGKNCIIGAFSYVSGNIPDYSIVRGLPAEIVGSTKDEKFSEKDQQ